MRKIIIFTSIIFFTFFNYPAKAFSDPATTAAVLQQTAIQTAEHLRQLEQAIQEVQTLQAQLSNAQGLLQLAQQSAQGVDGLQMVGDFRNVMLSTNDLINGLKSAIDTSQDLSGQWQKLFGSLDPWVQNANTTFSNIDVSDKTNASSYFVGDSYQRLYEQNATTVSQFVENAKGVSEKGALKQIAQELAQLIQMENNTTYVLAQILKSQSIEASNANLKRKETAAQFEQENQGIKSFMSIVDDKTFGI